MNIQKAMLMHCLVSFQNNCQFSIGKPISVVHEILEYGRTSSNEL